LGLLEVGLDEGGLLEVGRSPAISSVLPSITVALPMMSACAGRATSASKPKTLVADRIYGDRPALVSSAFA
jgi:hypothetical protein